MYSIIGWAISNQLSRNDAEIEDSTILKLTAESQKVIQSHPICNHLHKSIINNIQIQPFFLQLVNGTFRHLRVIYFQLLQRRNVFHG